MANKLKRRFIELDVLEISLVDEGAIETEVAIMKRKEQNMASQNKEQKTGIADTAKAKTSKSVESPNDTTTVEVDADEDVTKRLVDVVEALIAKSTSVQTPSDSTGAKESGTVDLAKSREICRKALKDSGLAETEVEKLLEGVSVKTEKSVPPPPVDDVVSADEAQAQTLEALSDAIQKAKKFTPKRILALASTVKTLNELLDGFSPASDAGKINTSETPSVEGVKKTKEAAAEEFEAAVAKSVQKQLGPLVEQLKILKETRTPSTAASPESGPSPKAGTETVDTEKGLWSNLFH